MLAWNLRVRENCLRPGGLQKQTEFLDFTSPAIIQQKIWTGTISFFKSSSSYTFQQ